MDLDISEFGIWDLQNHGFMDVEMSGCCNANSIRDCCSAVVLLIYSGCLGNLKWVAPGGTRGGKSWGTGASPVQNKSKNSSK